MANFDVSNADFSTVLRELEITDRGHADTFNPLFLRLIKNDAFLKAYVDQQISNLINGAPGALDTLKELADALGDDSNFKTTVLTTIAEKVAQTDFNSHVSSETAHGIGDKSQLKTTAKDTIVNALNELKNSIPSVPVQSVNNKTGSVSLGASDITVADISKHFKSNPKNIENVLSEIISNIPSIPNSLPANGGNSTTVNNFSASGIPPTNEKTNIIGMISELFTSGTNGKNDIYNAISAKGTTPASKNFADLVTAIGNISTGKRFATGSVTGSPPELTFTRPTNSIALYAFTLDKNAIGFMPSIIIIYGANYFSTVYFSTVYFSAGLYNWNGMLIRILTSDVTVTTENNMYADLITSNNLIYLPCTSHDAGHSLQYIAIE